MHLGPAHRPVRGWRLWETLRSRASFRSLGCVWTGLADFFHAWRGRPGDCSPRVTDLLLRTLLLYARTRVRRRGFACYHPLLGGFLLSCLLSVLLLPKVCDACTTPKSSTDFELARYTTHTVSACWLAERRGFRTSCISLALQCEMMQVLMQLEGTVRLLHNTDLAVLF
ncbi:uncharacterized protein F5Z01DRAFT_464180 [Emericellopsis atlantica]|uniref:Uncharacterized protein n=1 Tax=Emericellopsis atlantica TaxID=2614577 RepID=A0A9P8CU30_9HYPO|nr:uncharacterized protein F5Z01DRAFT_464180 [Emericellopsis atlantica]KAG9257311.1 hypothetical protein F5Z01DRAFT_464180 [Emericellopsis atlantica]